jgi:hypothetical protein
MLKGRRNLDGIKELPTYLNEVAEALCRFLPYNLLTKQER